MDEPGGVGLVELDAAGQAVLGDGRSAQGPGVLGVADAGVLGRKKRRSSSVGPQQALARQRQPLGARPRRR